MHQIRIFNSYIICFDFMLKTKNISYYLKQIFDDILYIISVFIIFDITFKVESVSHIAGKWFAIVLCFDCCQTSSVIQIDDRNYNMAYHSSINSRRV